MERPEHIRIRILDRIVEILEGVPEIDGSVVLDLSSSNNPSDAYEVTVVYVTEPSEPIGGRDPQPTAEAGMKTWMQEETVAPISGIDSRSLIVMIEILHDGRNVREMMGVESAVMEALFGPDVDWHGLVDDVEFQGAGMASGKGSSSPFILCAIALEISYSTRRGMPGIPA